MTPSNFFAFALRAALCVAIPIGAACAQAARSVPVAPASPPAPPPAAQSPLPAAKLTIGLHLVTAEVADQDRTRQMGLMFREKLAPNHGMVFVFDYRGVQCMWMRNTLIPLSVAFIDDDGRIVNIENMKPKDETTRHCSSRPVRYALEMTQGWFAERKIGPDAVIRGLPKPR
jgi:uncharacterized membrane protein (UPF0127 family)